jgi:hypothetical protein
MKPSGLVLDACGVKEGSWEAWKLGSWEKEEGLEAKKDMRKCRLKFRIVG